MNEHFRYTCASKEDQGPVWQESAEGIFFAAPAQVAS